MKLSEERKSELREVKECCKVSLPEFKTRYNNLDKIGKITVYQSIIDEDLEFEGDKLNESSEKVLEFLRSDKSIAKILLRANRSNEPIKDEDGNEYDVYGLTLY